MRSCFVLIIFLAGICKCLSLNWSGNTLKEQSHTSTNSLPSPPFISTIKTPKRFLRSYDAPKQDNIGHDTDERAGISGIAMIDDLAYKWALKNTRDPMDAFQRLHVVKTGGKLEGNKEFIRWLQYVNRYKATRRVKFGEDELLSLLMKTRAEEELVSLFQSLRQYPDITKMASDMQASMILSSASSHRLINEAWLMSRETPGEVFKILRLGDNSISRLENNPLFIQWLRYVTMYRAVHGRIWKHYLSVSRLYHNLNFLIQSLQNFPDLEKLALSLQTHLYRKWMIEIQLTPSELLGLLETTRVARSDPKYRNLEAYTMYFAESRGGTPLLNKLKTLFTDVDPYAALSAASSA